MKEMKYLNGYEVVDAKAREEIAKFKGSTENSLKIGNTEINEDQLKMLLDTLRYDIKGAWLITPYSEGVRGIIDENINFTSILHNVEFNGMKTVEGKGALYFRSAKDQYVYYSSEDMENGTATTLTEGEWFEVVSDEATYVNEIYTAIKFNETQKVTAQFIDFMERNATPMISFIIDRGGEDDSFSCPAGMTWGEFVNSEYNTNGFICIRTEDNVIAIHDSGDDEVHADHDDYPCIWAIFNEEEKVRLEDEIINGYVYETDLG